MSETTQSFLDAFSDGHPVIEVKLDEGTPSPFIVLRYEGVEVIINPLALHDHLSVDVHAFTGGERATAGVMAVSNGNRYSLPETGTTSHGWASAELVAVIIGKQAQA